MRDVSPIYSGSLTEDDTHEVRRRTVPRAQPMRSGDRTQNLIDPEPGAGNYWQPSKKAKGQQRKKKH